MRKAGERKYTDVLNVDLAKVSAALSTMRSLLDDMPGSKERDQIIKLVTSAGEATENAFGCMEKIMRAADLI